MNPPLNAYIAATLTFYQDVRLYFPHMSSALVEVTNHVKVILILIYHVH